MIIEIFLFCILRLTFLIIINEDRKYKYPIYTYYVSLIYQLFILPILCMLYYFNIIKIHFIFNCSIAYFVSDIIQLIFLNDINLLLHHVISLLGWMIPLYDNNLMLITRLALLVELRLFIRLFIILFRVSANGLLIGTLEVILLFGSLCG